MTDSRREPSLSALLIAPDREIMQQFQAAVQQTRAFQILAELKSYPPVNTLDVRLRQLKPDIVLIDVASNLAAALELTSFLSAQRPPIHVVGLHRSNDSAVLVQVLRAGASEFLFSPFDPVAQKDALGRLRRLRQPDTEAAHTLGKTIVFTSAKPGSGSSTLATHLAHAIRKATARRVLLIDMDLEGGTVAFFLKLQNGASVVDALERAEQLDANLWQSLVSNSGGIDVLAAPDTPYNETVDPSRLHEVFEYARILYDWIIVDAPSVFHRSTLLSVSEAEQTYLVATGDLASLHLARKAVQLLAQLGLSKDRYQMVVNRVSRKDGIAGSDIEKIFNCPVFASVPNDYFPLHRVISLGQPLAPDCELGRSLMALASKISTAGTEKKTATTESKAAPQT